MTKRGTFIFVLMDEKWIIVSAMVRCDHGHLVCAEDVIKRAKKAGLRQTKALEQVVRALAEAETPVTLKDLQELPRLKETEFDRTTLFRLLNRLCEQGLVRRLGLHERAAFFTLAMPGGCHDYIICRECGRVELMDVECPLPELEKKVAENSGYRDLYHELEFYGICPACG